MKKILKKIFSVTNEYRLDKKHKVFNICGIKMKFEKSIKEESVKEEKMKEENIKKTGSKEPVQEKITVEKPKMYSTAKYVLAMLLAYKIEVGVASPGTCNAYFNLISQGIPNFKIFSVIDERGAVYTAVGLAHELNTPIFTTCTGATAARNYMSGMTEAYYRNVPVIAITFFDSNNNKYNMRPQYTDRSVHQNDIREISVTLPKISDENDKRNCLVLLNAALSTAVYRNKPVHINCPASFDFKEIADDPSLPKDIWTTQYVNYDEMQDLNINLENKKTAVFIGSHCKFKEDVMQAVSNFAQELNIPVFCDHTSNYHGKNKVLITQAVKALGIEYIPDLIIDFGNVCGNYSAPALFRKAQVWRISPEGDFKCRYNKPVSKIFYSSEKMFFSVMKSNLKVNGSYYNTVLSRTAGLSVPSELPLSTSLVTRTLASKMPQNSSLHLAILKCLQSMNYFNLPESVDVTCNVGGFGIDGPVSTVFGHSLAQNNKKTFAVIGDLAFFYDMNILGNRHISNNLKIILVNNGKGFEFRFNPAIEKYHSSKTDVLVAAANHNKGGAEGWALSCGFDYLKANTKQEFLDNIDIFIKDNDKPILFEVFTNDDDERTALRSLGI